MTSKEEFETLRSIGEAQDSNAERQFTDDLAAKFLSAILTGAIAAQVPSTDASIMVRVAFNWADLFVAVQKERNK